MTIAVRKLPLISITGQLNSGKGTVAKLFREKGFVEIGFADPLKKIVQELFDVPDDVLWGPSPKRTPEVRRMLQELGTDYARKYRPNIWVDKFKKRVKELETSEELPVGIVVSDLRFLNEATAVHELGGKIIRVTRPNGNSHADANINSHESETAGAEIPDLLIDCTLENHGTLNDFQLQAQAIVRELIPC